MTAFKCVHVVRSEMDRNFYVGLTTDLRRRVQQHQNGEVLSTRNRTPFVLVYYEASLDIGDAARREKYLKSAWGKRFIKSRLQNYFTG